MGLSKLIVNGPGFLAETDGTWEFRARLDMAGDRSGLVVQFEANTPWVAVAATTGGPVIPDGVVGYGDGAGVGTLNLSKFLDGVDVVSVRVIVKGTPTTPGPVDMTLTVADEVGAETVTGSYITDAKKIQPTVSGQFTDDRVQVGQPWEYRFDQLDVDRDVWGITSWRFNGSPALGDRFTVHVGDEHIELDRGALRACGFWAYPKGFVNNLRVVRVTGTAVTVEQGAGFAFRWEGNGGLLATGNIDVTPRPAVSLAAAFSTPAAAVGAMWMFSGVLSVTDAVYLGQMVVRFGEALGTSATVAIDAVLTEMTTNGAGLDVEIPVGLHPFVVMGTGTLLDAVSALSVEFDGDPVADGTIEVTG